MNDSSSEAASSAGPAPLPVAAVQDGPEYRSDSLHIDIGDSVEGYKECRGGVYLALRNLASEQTYSLL